MANKRTLEEVLADLKAAEKEYKEKCEKYGIEDKKKKKKADDEPNLQEEITNEALQEGTSEN